VTAGEALAQARRQAGLSVAQVSQKTRIREAIIRDIERDDYSALGADFYARGHIRAMARAIGVDSEAFVRRYDAARGAGAPVAEEQVTAEPLRSAREPAAAEEFGPDGFAAPEEFAPGGFAASEEFAPGGLAAPDSPGAGGFAAPDEGGFAPQGEHEAPEELTAPNPAVPASQMATFDDIMASGPAASPEGAAPPRGRPLQPSRPPRSAPAREPRRPDRVVIAAVALALAIFGGLAYLLVAGTKTTPQAGAAAATGRAGQRQAASGRRHHGATNSPTATPSGATPSSAPPAVLTPARAVAFGPGGPAHGDDPGGAALAIDHRPGTAWQTDWYATSHFGGLQRGTGLLLGMGHRVTITSARITLGAAPGADLQLRAGDSATLAGLRPVATATNAHGTIRLRLATPVRARYVLIWFTQLPPDPAGTYQANVYNVRLR
jgi:transcriptional regulator with XRE-family HTH domain